MTVQSIYLLQFQGVPAGCAHMSECDAPTVRELRAKASVMVKRYGLQGHGFRIWKGERASAGDLFRFGPLLRQGVVGEE